jgi:hypothetical protein
VQLCMFCGGDADEPDHEARCDGRQGRVEERFEPLLVSGVSAATWDTSEAAAVSVEDTRDTQRALVRAAIVAAGPEGRTDDELQLLLQLDGSSERPRRWELWKMNRIRVRTDPEGKPVRRLTRTNRSAVVWVAA